MRTCNLAPAPVDQLAGPAGDSITFSEAPVTQSNFLWDPDPSAPKDWWSTFASDPSQSIAPLNSFGQPTDTTESSMKKGSAERRSTSADVPGQKERVLLEHKLEVNRRAQKRFRERRKVATGRHAMFLSSVLHQKCFYYICMLCSCSCDNNRSASKHLIVSWSTQGQSCKS